MAGLRERCTSFRQSCDYAVKVRAIELATDAPTISLAVDDVLARIGNGIDFSDLFVVESTPATCPVPSLTAASGRGIATLHGVNINAMV